MTKSFLNGNDWQIKGFIGADWVRRISHLPTKRDLREWYPAEVPGCVQNDLWKARRISDPYFEMNTLAAEWVSQRTLVYRKVFSVDRALQGKRVRLVFEGVDYSAQFYLNGTLLGQHTGMFLPVAFDVENLLDYEGENYLAVVIDPAPEEQPQVGYTCKVHTQKTRMNYSWDFCPRLVALGIWQDVYLQASGLARIEEIHVQPQLSADLTQAEVEVNIVLDRKGQQPIRAEVLLLFEGEQEVLKQMQVDVPAGEAFVPVHFHLEEPEIWWPNGEGDQPLYQVLVRVFVDHKISDTGEQTFGIRQIAFVPNEGAQPGALPYNMVVNGRKIYIRGWNWVPMDVMYGVQQPQKRERLLRLAQRAHVNMLRVWGGGLIEQEAFYRQCDRLGLLVWQEFIQSSSGIENTPSEDPEFIRFLVENAEAAIRARRNHPALALWCGGNELFTSQVALCDDHHPALAALKDAVIRLDPGRHWVPTSPAGGVFSYKMLESEEEAQQLQDVHGPWEYQGLRQHYALYNQSSSMLHSEFGVEGITNLRTLNRTVTAENQWPVNLENLVWRHLGAWWVKEDVWQDAFGGPFAEVAAVQRATQFLQADGLRYAVEADRRRMYRNGGSLPWQFNEPYPMAACTSAVDFYAQPKPVYYTVARAYRPVAVSARYDTIAWGEEQEFQAQVWSANAGAQREGLLRARILLQDGKVIWEKQTQSVLPANAAAELMTVQFPVEQIPASTFFLDIIYQEDQAGLVAENRYLFSRTANLGPLLYDVPLSSLQVHVTKEVGQWTLGLENISDQAALWVWLESEDEDLRNSGSVFFSDNYFCLLPGEQRAIQVTWHDEEDAHRAVLLSGWNIPPVKLE